MDIFYWFGKVGKWSSTGGRQLFPAHVDFFNYFDGGTGGTTTYLYRNQLNLKIELNKDEYKFISLKYIKTSLKLHYITQIF